MDNSKKNNWTFASLIIRGKNPNLEEFIKRINISPTKHFQRGDIRKNLKKWPHGYWELNSKEFVDSTDLAKHLEWLVEQFESINIILIELANQPEIDVEISCFWVLPSTNSNLNLSSHLLSKLASLGLQVNLDIFSP